MSLTKSSYFRIVIVIVNELTLVDIGAIGTEWFYFIPGVKYEVVGTVDEQSLLAVRTGNLAFNLRTRLIATPSFHGENLCAGHRQFVVDVYAVLFVAKTETDRKTTKTFAIEASELRVASRGNFLDIRKCRSYVVC